MDAIHEGIEKYIFGMYGFFIIIRIQGNVSCLEREAFISLNKY